MKAIFVILLLNIVWKIRAEVSPQVLTIQVPVPRNDTAPSQSPSQSPSWRRLAPASSKKRRNLGTERISDECSKADISIFQGRSSPLFNGIPTYTVQIINLCVVGCPLSNIHIACGWFASTKLVNPKLFRRVGFNDCIVNDGKPIAGGESIFFHYANSFQYPLKVVSAACG